MRVSELKTVTRYDQFLQVSAGRTTSHPSRAELYDIGNLVYEGRETHKLQHEKHMMVIDGHLFNQKKGNNTLCHVQHLSLLWTYHQPIEIIQWTSQTHRHTPATFYISAEMLRNPFLYIFLEALPLPPILSPAFGTSHSNPSPHPLLHPDKITCRFIFPASIPIQIQHPSYCTPATAGFVSQPPAILLRLFTSKCTDASFSRKKFVEIVA